MAEALEVVPLVSFVHMDDYYARIPWPWAGAVILLALLLPTCTMAWYSGINNKVYDHYHYYPSRCNCNGRLRKLHQDALLLNAESQTISHIENVHQQSTSEYNDNGQSSAHSLHLISLPPTNDTFALQGESLVRECWRWKDAALGDGRDYFVPRPKALKAFQSLFVGMEITVVCDGEEGVESIIEVVLKPPTKEVVEVRLPLLTQGLTVDSILTHEVEHSSPKGGTFSQSFLIEECAALSNCARLDVILVLKTITQQGEANNFAVCLQKMIAKTAARYVVAYNLQKQIHAQRSKSKSLLERTGLSSWLDLDDGITKDQTTSASRITNKQCTEMNQLGERLTSMEGAYEISNHLCLIAGGLAPRPSRPDREVIFRPYSSRDAREFF